MKTMSLAARLRSARRHGLTLIELVVVMVILIALAGILLPLFPSMLTRAHTSTTATNLAEVSKAVNLYYNLYQGYPNNLDNLATTTTSGTTTSNGIFSLVPAGQSTDLSTYTLTANDLSALTGAGITNVLPVVENAGGLWTPTFNPYSAVAETMTSAGLPANSTTIGTVSSSGTATSPITVVQVSQAAVTRELGVIPAATTNPAVYVLFGVGDYTSMAGKTLEEAPYHFDDGAGVNPSTYYCRFGVVFQTQDGSGTPMSLARYIGAVDLDDTGGITSASDHIQAYFQTK